MSDAIDPAVRKLDPEDPAVCSVVGHFSLEVLTEMQALGFHAALQWSCRPPRASLSTNI